MPIIINEGEHKEIILVPADTYSACCYNVWDLGWQKTTYMGAEKTVAQIIIGFEIDALIPEGNFQGKRFTMTKKYTKSLFDKSNLRKDLESWRGKPFTAEELKGFDIENLVGAPCMLSVIHKPSKDGKRTYANVGAVMKLPKGTPAITPENKRTTPEWIAKLIAAQVEPPESIQAHADEGDAAEAIPF